MHRVQLTLTDEEYERLKLDCKASSTRPATRVKQVYFQFLNRTLECYNPVIIQQAQIHDKTKEVEKVTFDSIDTEIEIDDID